MEEPPDALVEWLAAPLDIPPTAFADYADRPQTMTDHALLLARTLGLRPPSNADLPFMIEAAAQSAWSTDRGQPIVAGVIAALRAARIILPAPTVIERTAIAGRARARKRTADALLAGLSPAQLAKLDTLLIPDPALKATPFGWLKNASTSPKPDHVRALLDRLRFVRDIGVPPDAAARIHNDSFQQLVREGRISDAHQISRYVAHRRRAILVAAVLDLETRLTDAVLDMADKLIGGLFARARKARERRYVAGTRNVARLMGLFHDTIEALGTARNGERDAFTVVDETVGWARLLRVQGRSGGPVIDAPIPFEHFGPERRQRRPAAACPARRGRHNRLGERLIHAVEQQPCALVGHAHIARGGGDRSCISVLSSSAALPGPIRAPDSKTMLALSLAMSALCQG
jgi:hypothetical protein